MTTENNTVLKNEQITFRTFEGNKEKLNKLIQDSEFETTTDFLNLIIEKSIKSGQLILPIDPAENEELNKKLEHLDKLSKERLEQLDKLSTLVEGLETDLEKLNKKNQNLLEENNELEEEIDAFKSTTYNLRNTVKSRNTMLIASAFLWVALLIYAFNK